MSKAFHGVINIWWKTWLFYQTPSFTISFLCFDVSLVSQYITGFCFYLAWFSPIPQWISFFPLQDQELNFLLEQKGKAFCLSISVINVFFPSIITILTCKPHLFHKSAESLIISLYTVCHVIYFFLELNTDSILYVIRILMFFLKYIFINKFLVLI